MKLKTLAQTPITNRRVLVRADLNVPFASDGTISDDYRLIAIKPTLDYLINHQATIMLATHLGKPKPGLIDPNLSTKRLIPWFEQQGYHITHCPDLAAAQALSRKPQQPILLLENVRFLAGEKEGNRSLAEQYKALADIYVNDAFGTCHRADTTIAVVPTLFAPDNRCIGLRLEEEITVLERLRTKPKQPFMLVLGGCKLEDKVPLIAAFLNARPHQRPHTIAIGGDLALPFLQANWFTAKNDMLSGIVQQAAAIITQAAANNVQLLLPTDEMVTEWDNAIKVMEIKQIFEEKYLSCVDIGPVTIQAFTDAIAKANTIFTNGTMGIYETPAYEAGTKAILTAIANNRGFTVAGGGNCAAALSHYGLRDRMGFVSTGGGATLAYLSARWPLKELPGLSAILTP